MISTHAPAIVIVVYALLTMAGLSNEVLTVLFLLSIILSYVVYARETSFQMRSCRRGPRDRGRHHDRPAP